LEGDVSVESPTRPVLRYHGGKHRAAQQIVSLFPPHDIYCEPYGGAASVLMAKPRSASELYNDLDGEIVNYFRVLRDPWMSEQLCRAIQLTPYSREEFDQAFESVDDPVEQARRTAIKAMMGCGSRGATSKHRTGFRWRDRRDGWARAEHLWIKYPAAIANFCQRLQGVVIECKPAVQVIERMGKDSNCLIYADPPYVLSACADRSEGRSYRYSMTDADHRALATTLKSVRAMVIISGYRTPLYDELYEDWDRIDFSNRTQHSGVRIESLWISPNARTPQGQLFGEDTSKTDYFRGQEPQEDIRVE
jgi:DNA adenine methylase